jgi:hypothetical protein
MTITPARRITPELGTELAQRTSNGMDIALFWHKPTNRITVVVHDIHLGDRYELDVDPARANYAFNHPFAYAASQDRPTRQARPVAIRP